VDQNYKRKRKEQRLKLRLTELDLARSELNNVRAWSLSDQAFRNDVLSIMVERKSINAQILDIERKLLIRRN
jgi:hypothetical protein